MKLFWVYMVLCDDGSYYIGVTHDVDYCVAQHNAGEFPECCTFTRRPGELVYADSFRDANDAIRWENKLRNGPAPRRQRWREGIFEELRRLSKGARPT
jgi:putative endonuclease